MNKQEQQHTPGPWRVVGDTVKGPRGNIVAECVGYSVQAADPAQRVQGGREANARLIAAAPALLDALKEVYGWHRRATDERQQSAPVLRDYLYHAREAARAAIAQAEGVEG